jgi:ABC-type transport system substrate-binding protein
LKNRNVRVPYVDFGTFVIQEWRKISIEVEHQPLETASWFADGRDTGSFELMSAPRSISWTPDQFLERYARATATTGAILRSEDRRPLCRQARSLDPTERKKLIYEIEKIVLGQVYYIPGIWWARSVVHWAKVKNYVAPPNHYSNQKLQDVWLSED